MSSSTDRATFIQGCPQAFVRYTLSLYATFSITYRGCRSGISNSKRCMVNIFLRRLGMVLRLLVKCVLSAVTPMLFTRLRVGMIASPLFSSIDAQKMLS